MNNLRKRILSLLLTGAMTLSMATPFTALAEGVEEPADSNVVVQEQGASTNVQEEAAALEGASHSDDAASLSEEEATESPAPADSEPGDTATEPDGEQTSAGNAVPSEDESANHLQALAEEGVAQIGDAHYDSLQEAVAAAAAGQTITLLKDVQLSAAVTISKNLTIVAQSGAVVTISRAGGLHRSAVCPDQRCAEAR